MIVKGTLHIENGYYICDYRVLYWDRRTVLDNGTVSMPVNHGTDKAIKFISDALANNLNIFDVNIKVK